MTRIATGRLLFIVFLITVPLPYMIGGVEQAPWLRLAFLSGLIGSVFAVEGGSMLGMLTGLGVAQSLVYAGILYGAARLSSAAISRFATSGVRWSLTLLVTLGLLAYSFTERYSTGLSSTRPLSNVTQLFQ